jgi:hypothetical protein
MAFGYLVKCIDWGKESVGFKWKYAKIIDFDQIGKTINEHV